jgi:hypothetical protein
MKRKNVNEMVCPGTGTGAERRTHVGLGAIEDGLVAAHGLGDVSEGLYDAEAELLSLHLARDGDVFDVTDAAEATQEFVLQEDAAGADYTIGLARDDDEDVICLGLAAHGVELSRPRLCAHVGCLRQDGEHGEVAALVVGRSQGPHLRGFKQHPGRIRIWRWMEMGRKETIRDKRGKDKEMPVLADARGARAVTRL